MRLKKGFVFGFLAVLVIVGCKKSNEDLKPTSGIYRGVFNKIYNGIDSSSAGIVFLAINSDDSLFTLKGDTSSMTPVTCNGSYQLYGGDKIEFKNKVSFEEGTLLDEHFILDTIYTYTFYDSTFNLSFLNGDDSMSYSYNLRRY